MRQYVGDDLIHFCWAAPGPTRRADPEINCTEIIQLHACCSPGIADTHLECDLMNRTKNEVLLLREHEQPLSFRRGPSERFLDQNMKSSFERFAYQHEMGRCRRANMYRIKIRRIQCRHFRCYRGYPTGASQCGCAFCVGINNSNDLRAETARRAAVPITHCPRANDRYAQCPCALLRNGRSHVRPNRPIGWILPRIGSLRCSTQPFGDIG